MKNYHLYNVLVTGKSRTSVPQTGERFSVKETYLVRAESARYAEWLTTKHIFNESDKTRASDIDPNLYFSLSTAYSNDDDRIIEMVSQKYED